MNINHPLYNVLKDYYTNLSKLSSIPREYVDNNLLFQYIEDTCGIDKDDNNFICFKLFYLNCFSMYFINFKTSKITGKIELYCCFTNKFLNKYIEINLADNYNVGIYKYICCKYSQCIFLYLSE
jgi:hypothetical protein